MKCSHIGDFIIILLIILTANDKGKAFALLSNEKSFDKNSVQSGVFSASENTLQDLDSFPNMNNADNPKHRIVKKQMVISDEYQLLGKNKNSLTDKEKRFSTDTSTNFKDNNVNIASGFNSWIIQKFNEHEGLIPSNNERKRLIRQPKEDEERSTKLKASKWNKCRLKRGLLLKKKVDIPDINTDNDVEPSNEWTDASHDSKQKVPPEFKPKPKLKLKVFHLMSKRESKNHEMENPMGKRQTWNRFKCLDARRRTFHPAKVYSTRVHPRSFLVRIKKKGENKTNHREEKKSEPEKQEKDDEEDDEGSEEDEDDQDDEEEDEETEYEDSDEESVSITTKPKRKDAIKEFFRTAKEAVINRAKFNDGFVSGSFKAEGGKESLTPNKNEKNESFSEKSKKVLIDANIKLDGAISHALKSLLGYRKEKSNEHKENDEKLSREKETEENLNVKNTNNESQLTGSTEQPLENNRKNKRHLLSLLSKKNRDGEGSEKGGLVSVDSLINCINSEYGREELLQKLQQIKYKDTKFNRYDLLVK